METFPGDCDFMLKSSEKFFSFSLMQFLASRDFVDRLGLLKCSKDFHNTRNLEIIFLVSKLELYLNGDPFDLNVYFLCFHYQL